MGKTLICVETTNENTKEAINILYSYRASEMFCRRLGKDTSIINCCIPFFTKKKIRKEMNKLGDSLVYFLA